MSIKILLADDSITIQRVVGIIFGGDEYALTVVDNGKSAVEKAGEINPDILLIDALMPGMSGYEVCEAVRATPALANKPILLLTGSFEPFDEDKAKSCGADDFLAKPFESQQIVTKVRELIEQATTRPAAAAVEASAPAEAAGDIWGAFTEPEAPAAPQFAEELEGVSLDEPAPAKADTIGSQWVPVEEETFAFDEAAEPVAPAAAISVEESVFGDVEFEEPAVEVTPAAVEKEPATEIGDVEFEEPAPAPVQEVAAPAAAPAAAAVPAVAAAVPELSEEQLRAAILSASREVLERIVWEVVPDLAEVMIKEAIEKIKRGE